MFIPAITSKLLIPEEEQRQREAFDMDILGFFYMGSPMDHVKEVLGIKWAGLQKIWKVVSKDYELRELRNKFLSELEFECSEKTKSLVEWREYIKKGAQE